MSVITHSFNQSSEASTRGFLVLKRNADVERMEGLPRFSAKLENGRADL